MCGRRSDGTWPPSWPEPSWRRLAGFSCLLALLLLTSPRTAFGQSGPKPTPQSIESDLLILKATCGALKQALSKRVADSLILASALDSLKGQSEDLSKQVADLQTQLAGSQNSLDQSVATMLRLTDLLERSRADLKELSATFDSFKAHRDQDVADFGRRAGTGRDDGGTEKVVGCRVRGPVLDLRRPDRGAYGGLVVSDLPTRGHLRPASCPHPRLYGRPAIYIELYI